MRRTRISQREYKRIRSEYLRVLLEQTANLSHVTANGLPPKRKAPRIPSKIIIGDYLTARLKFSRNTGSWRAKPLSRKMGRIFI